MCSGETGLEIPLQGLPSAARLPAAPSPAEIQRDFVPRSLRRMLQLRGALAGGGGGGGGGKPAVRKSLSEKSCPRKST